MYGGGVLAINTGVPAAALYISATGQWSFIGGITLATTGALGITLALRSRRQRRRDFAA